MKYPSQARSQKSAMRGCFGGLIAEPAARGHSGSEGRVPSRWKILYLLQNGHNFRLILIKTIALKRGIRSLLYKNLIKLFAETGYVEGGNKR